MVNAVVNHGCTDPGDAWDAHWTEFGDTNERNPAQEYRRRLTLRLVEASGAPQRLLDIGSGNGEFLAEAANRWPTAALRGLELSESAVTYASAKVPSARFSACDLVREVAPVDDAHWATHAICSEVLEHVDDPVTLLRNARTWLAPGCRVVVTVPGGPMSAFDKHIGHRRHFSPEAIGQVISAAGLEVREAGGAGFPFFNVYRAVVIARGERLISDASATAAGTVSGLIARAAMAAFRPLFLLNLSRSRRGWQTVAVAQEPR